MKSISEGKQRVDEQLGGSWSLLQDTLAREMTKRISAAYPYVFSPTEYINLIYTQFTCLKGVFP